MTLNHDFPDRDLVNSQEWQLLCRRAQVCSCYGIAEGDQDEDGFENEICVIRPYDWSEPDERLPNFEHKPSGFKVWWYKYAFRGAEMNQRRSTEEIKALFQSCADSIPVTLQCTEQEAALRKELQEEIQALVEAFNARLEEAQALGVDIRISGQEDRPLKKIKGYYYDEGVTDLFFLSYDPEE